MRRPWPVDRELAELGEHLTRHRRAAEDLLVDDELTVAHLADRVSQLGGLAVLVQVSGRASADGLEEDLLLVLRGQDDHADSG